jgi:hypothetical protein
MYYAPYNFSSVKDVETVFGARPSCCPVDTGGLCPVLKRQGREADHSPPTSAEVKIKRGSIHPLPHTSSWRSA